MKPWLFIVVSKEGKRENLKNLGFIDGTWKAGEGGRNGRSWGSVVTKKTDLPELKARRGEGESATNPERR